MAAYLEMPWQPCLFQYVRQLINHQLVVNRCSTGKNHAVAAGSPVSWLWQNQAGSISINCVLQPTTANHSLVAALQLATFRSWSYPWHHSRASSFSSHSAGEPGKQKIVFMGTPHFSALVLRDLCNAARQQGANFEVVAVVSKCAPYQQPRPTALSALHAHHANSAAQWPTSMSHAHASTVLTHQQHPQSSTVANPIEDSRHPCELVDASDLPEQGHTQLDMHDASVPVGYPMHPQQSGQQHITAAASIQQLPAHHTSDTASPSIASDAVTGQVMQLPTSFHCAAHTAMSPVIAEALRQGLTHTQLLCPSSAKQEEFLNHMETVVRPDLVVTAAYGSILPQRFLDIPRLGTINIHPSLLPKYRGAAPVQRCLQDGCTHTGVSVTCTVLKCDAGPVLAQQEVQVLPDEQSPELTTRLFALGSKMLLQYLPLLLSGQASSIAIAQDHQQATYAPKLSRSESGMDFSSKTAQQLHNQVRALAGWPGTHASFILHNKSTGQQMPLPLKVLRTRVITHAAQLSQHECPTSLMQTKATARDRVAEPATHRPEEQHTHTTGKGVHLSGLAWALPAHQASNVQGHLVVPCAGGTFLQLCQVRYMDSHKQNVHNEHGLSGSEFLAGIGKQALLLLPPVHGALQTPA